MPLHVRGEPEAALAAWPTLTNVTAAMVRAGMRTTVVVTARGTHEAAHGRGREIFREIGRDGARYLFLPSHARRLPRCLAVRATVRALAPDVVHLHGVTEPLLTWMLGGVRAPLVLQEHGASRFGVRGALVRRLAWRRVRGVMCTGGAAQGAHWRGLLPSRCEWFDVVGGSTTFTDGDRAAARTATGTNGTPAVLWVARLREDKDPMVALDAVARASETLPGLTFTMVYGTADRIEQVRARVAADARLQDRVRLLGRVDRPTVEQLMRAADVLLHPSRLESCGFSTIEALACGTPVVSADIPTARRLLGATTAGAVVPLGDSAAAADAIVRFASLGPDAGRAVRAEARAHFERDLAFDAIARQQRDAYARLVR